jgi:hypothetical protein
MKQKEKAVTGLTRGVEGLLKKNKVYSGNVSHWEKSKQITDRPQQRPITLRAGVRSFPPRRSLSMPPMAPKPY